MKRCVESEMDDAFYLVAMGECCVTVMEEVAVMDENV